MNVFYESFQSVTEVGLERFLANARPFYLKTVLKRLRKRSGTVIRRWEMFILNTINVPKRLKNHVHDSKTKESPHLIEICFDIE